MTTVDSTAMNNKEYKILEEIPQVMNDVEVMNYLENKKVDWKYINAIKNMTDFSDEILSSWLNISIRTFRNYKKSNAKLKNNTKEQIVLLMSLMKHGMKVFDTKEDFEAWLDNPNFFFDNKKPNSFLNTVSGIRFVDNRLTAMEFGDNV